MRTTREMTSQQAHTTPHAQHNALLTTACLEQPMVQMMEAIPAGACTQRTW
jgi:hypothetical protein